MLVPPLTCWVCMKAIYPEHNVVISCDTCLMAFYCSEHCKKVHQTDEGGRHHVGDGGECRGAGSANEYLDQIVQHTERIRGVSDSGYDRITTGLFRVDLRRGGSIRYQAMNPTILRVYASSEFYKGRASKEAKHRLGRLLRSGRVGSSECMLGLFHFHDTPRGESCNYQMAVLYVKDGIWYYEATSGYGLAFWHSPLDLRLEWPHQTVKEWQTARFVHKGLGLQEALDMMNIEDLFEMVYPKVTKNGHEETELCSDFTSLGVGEGKSIGFDIQSHKGTSIPDDMLKDILCVEIVFACNSSPIEPLYVYPPDGRGLVSYERCVSKVFDERGLSSLCLDTWTLEDGTTFLPSHILRSSDTSDVSVTVQVII